MSIDLGIKEISRNNIDNAVDFAAFSGAKKAAPGGVTDKTADRTETKQDLSPKNIEKIASDVQIQLKRLNTELRFVVDTRSKDVVIKIVDQESGQVIRQIPSEEIISLRERMSELIGVLFKAKT